MNTAHGTLSVAMIAQNEEENLPRTLESVQWADEIVIVDSGSTDSTPEIARSFGAKFFSHQDFQGHGEQKNLALDRCTCEWILLLDADEVVSRELATEIQRTLKVAKYDAYWIPRLNLFLSRWMRYGGLYPDRKLRLFRRGSARLQEGFGPHATPQHTGHKGFLRSNLLHYAYPDLKLYLSHMNSYSSEMAQVLSKKKKRSRILLGSSILNPIANFIGNYVLRLGFLDGFEGLIFHLNHSLYTHWKYAKAWEALHKDDSRPQGALLSKE